MESESYDYSSQEESEDNELIISDIENGYDTSSEPGSFEEEEEDEEVDQDRLVSSLTSGISGENCPNNGHKKKPVQARKVVEGAGLQTRNVSSPSAISTPRVFYHKSVNSKESGVSMDGQQQVTRTSRRSVQKSHSTPRGSHAGSSSQEFRTPNSALGSSKKVTKKSVPSLTPTLPKRNESRHSIVGIGSRTNQDKQSGAARKLNSSITSSSSESADSVVYQDKLGEITNLLGSVVERLERIEEKVMKSSSSSGSSSDCSSKRTAVSHKVRAEVRMTYKALLDDVEGNFTGFDTSAEVTYKHTSNQDVASHLLQEVKGSNPNFSLSDIKAATYTYYKSLCQEATLRRRGVYEDRKVQRRRRERVIRRLNERTSEFNRMSYNETDKQKWKKVLLSSFMSSDESDMEDEVPVFVVKELQWRNGKVTKFFGKLDDAHQHRISEQAQRQTKPRLRRGKLSNRPAPSNVPAWAVTK